MTSKFSENDKWAGRALKETLLRFLVPYETLARSGPGLLLGRLALAERVVFGRPALAALTFCAASPGCASSRDESVHAIYQRTQLKTWAKAAPS